MKEWSQSDVEAATTRHVKNAATNGLTASMTGCIYVNVGTYIRASIEPPDKAEMTARYMLVGWAGCERVFT